MKTTLNIAKCLSFLSLLFLCGPALGNPIYDSQAGTDIRGRVVTVTQDAKVLAVPRARVDVYKADNKVHTTYTDTKGYYYFSNLAPGVYTIRVKQKDYTIKVEPKASNRQFQDIPQIRLG